MVWKRQGAAVTTAVILKNGAKGRVVLVAGKENPKGAVMLMSGGEQGAVVTTTLTSHYRDLTQEQLVAILCMQERVFGQSGLTAPELP
ncbi:MAG: hypothetical protein AMXMBFR84_15710 [Candidatus Hydrogenedentota bacterium]